MVLFDMIGANSYMWNRRHIRLHHNFTNVSGWNSDIEKSKFLKVHPLDEKKIVHRWHRFLVRDFKDFFNRNMIVRKLGKAPLAE